MIRLCLDFGNSRQKAALFRDGMFYGEISLQKERLPEQLREILEKHRPEQSILSSVIDYEAGVETVLDAHTFFVKLSAATPLPFRNAYESSQTLGADRLALAAGAYAEYPGSHNLAIAFGSCITFNFISKEGIFLGGSISPGVQMRFRAMGTFTDRLPLLAPEPLFPLIGYNTRQSMLSGVLNGVRAEVDGMIDLYREKYRNFNALLTGGDMVYFDRRLKNKIFADLMLSYKGLHAILEFNAGLRS